MSHKANTHLKGERGQAFTDRIRNIPPERILCVRYAWILASIFTS